MLLEDTDRLEKIDKLYTLRLDQYVSLPMVRLILNVLNAVETYNG